MVVAVVVVAVVVIALIVALAAAEDLVDGAVAQRDDVDRLPLGPVWTSVPTPKFRPISRLSLSVISHLCRLSATRSSSRGSSTRNPAPVAGETQPEQMPAFEERTRAGDEQVAVELRAEAAAVDEADPAGCDLELPRELRRAVVRAGQHEQARQRLGWRVSAMLVGDHRSCCRPKYVVGERIRRIRRDGRLDRLELRDALGTAP